MDSDTVADSATRLGAQMEGDYFYRVSFLAILDPDRAAAESPPRRGVRCPLRGEDVPMPLFVATGIQESQASYVAVVAGTESGCEHLGYMAYSTEQEALAAATIIAFHADAALRDVQAHGYIHVEVEVSACAWDTLGEQPTFNDSRRIKLITVEQPTEDSAPLVF